MLAMELMMILKSRPIDKSEFLSTADEIKALIPLLEEYDLKLAIENHEYQTSDDLLELLI
ncbi:hypothetical protein K4E85_03935 [Campylobacter coli]